MNKNLGLTMEQPTIKKVKYICSNVYCGIESDDARKIDRWGLFCTGILLCFFWGIGFIVMLISLFFSTRYLCRKCNSNCKVVLENNS